MKPPTNTTTLRPPLRLLQGRQAAAHTAPVQTPAAPLHGDQRLTDLIHATWWSGHDSGERVHYTQGWRTGLAVGIFWGLVVGLPVGAAAAAATRWLTTWGML
jgi:hypothetical protein